MNRSLLMLFVLAPMVLFAQEECSVEIEDYFICEAGELEIEGLFNPGFDTLINQYSINSIPFNYEDVSKAPIIDIIDDQVIGPFDLGFNFQFFNHSYDKFWISSNGFISFLPEAYGGYGVWALPDNGGPYACVFGAWEDWNHYSGNLRFSTLGVSPNKKLVVEFEDVSTYNCGAGQDTTGSFQITILESGEIEIHTKNRFPCTNGSQGIQNESGSFAFMVNGRNNENYTASNDAFRFTPQSNVSVDWYTINNEYVGSGGNLLLDAQESNSYIVSTNNGWGCSSSDTFNVQVSLPTPEITQNGNILLCDLGGYDYQWTFFEEIIEGEISQYLFPDSEGHYSVLITDTNGCTVSSDFFNVTSLSIGDLSKSYKLHPNPSVTGELNIETSKLSSLSIYNLEGKIVFSKRLNVGTNHLKTNLHKGVYFLHLETNGIREIKKWIVL